MAKAIYVEGMSHKSPIPAAKLCGNTLYSSLITGVDAATRTMPDSLEVQCTNMFAQMERILKAAGAKADDVAKVTVWVNDRKDKDAINGLWAQTFPNPETRPARVTLNRDLGLGKLIECEIIAVIS